MTALAIEKQLVEFLISVTGNGSLTGESDLLQSGIADSLTMMDLLVFIETEYQLRLDFTDLRPDVFRTPKTVASLLADRQEEQRRSIAA